MIELFSARLFQPDQQILLAVQLDGRRAGLLAGQRPIAQTERRVAPDASAPDQLLRQRSRRPPDPEPLATRAIFTSGKPPDSRTSRR